MNDHAFYLVCSYAALAVALVWELWALRRQRARAIEKVLDEQNDPVSHT